MNAAPVLLLHPSSLDHDTGPHPEQPARIVAIERALSARADLGFERVRSPAVPRAVLETVHPSSHVELIERVAARGGGHIDADTIVSAGSFAAALHACGGAVDLVDRLLSGTAPTGISIHRPPGHHAETGRAMGFCLFNNVAVAARHAVDAHGLDRVMIVDWDVHHGNGTNDIFHTEPQVLFCSIHQSPLYPGTGPASDVGSGPGRGFTVNLPVAPGAGDREFRSLIEHVVVPLARIYQPQLVLISAGYDAHFEDPLADCRVTDAGYAAMARALCSVAVELGAPVGAVLEGGYALDVLARSVITTMEVLGGGAPDDGTAPVSRDAERARGRLVEFWPSLA
ncbi:MAG: histone deacetylase [Solirubrobacteraceae bacterium]